MSWSQINHLDSHRYLTLKFVFIGERLKSSEDALADAVNSYNEAVEEENSDDEDWFVFVTLHCI